jgi:hypothetical protein
MKNILLFKHTKLLFLLSLLFFSSWGWGQIVAFEFVGLAGSENTFNATTVNPGLSTCTISRGAGLTASANADRFNATAWALTSISNAVSGNNYMEFSITPNGGVQFSVTSIIINIQRSGTGLSAIALRSSVDNYSTDLDAVKTVVDNTSTQTFTFTFSHLNSTNAITYRLYGYAESATGTGGPGDASGNDIIVNGTVISSDANLSGLVLSSGTLSPTFASGTTAYTATVSNATSTITVTPTRNEPNATIQARVNGDSYATVTSGTASSLLALNVGSNTIDVVVTAQNGSTTKTYTTTVTRAIPPTSTTWNGTAWSNGPPTSSVDAIIDGDYSTTTNGVFSAKTLTVNATRSITINSGNTITVAGAITDNGNLVVQNNASLLQTDVSATNSGSIIVNRNSANIQLYDYTLWSSPVAGQKLKAFSPDTLDARFYTYNSSTNQYNVVSAPVTTDFVAGTSYLIRAPNTLVAGAAAAPFSGTFTGVPNNGNINLTGLTSAKFYAVGNPYPSTISANLFLSGNTTEGTLYFWRKTNNSANTSYATYTTAGGVANSGGNSAIVPDGTIQVGQGFIVKTGASTTTLNFTNAMRTSSNTSPFLRTTEDRSRFWLNLTNNSGIFSQMLVGYMAEATSGIDNAIDGRYINDVPVALTSLIGSEEFTIQGRALPFSTSDSVPLGFKTDAAGNYTIAIDHVDGLFSTGQSIYLKDNLQNTVTDLSAGSYSFASAIGTFNSRFELVYQRVLGVNNPDFTSNNVIAFNDNGDIKINSGSTVMEQVRVYDLQGRLLVEKKQINANETKIATTASNQVLLLEITATNGMKVTKKIIQ